MLFELANLMTAHKPCSPTRKSDNRERCLAGNSIAKSNMPERRMVRLPRFRGRFRGWRTVGLFASPVRSKWARIPQGGVPPGEIVEAFDEAEAGHACLDLRGKAAPLEQFAFEGGKEALAQGVIVSVPDRAHRGPYAGFLAALAESQRGILAALDALLFVKQRFASD
jgi:hypothetical protein